MRIPFLFSSVVVGAILLSACGQSGSLHLTSDPKYDQRAKYLLYPHPWQKQQHPSNAEPAHIESSEQTTKP